MPVTNRPINISIFEGETLVGVPTSFRRNTAPSFRKAVVPTAVTSSPVAKFTSLDFFFSKVAYFNVIPNLYATASESGILSGNLSEKEVNKTKQNVYLSGPNQMLLHSSFDSRENHPKSLSEMSVLRHRQSSSFILFLCSLPLGFSSGPTCNIHFFVSMGASSNRARRFTCTNFGFALGKQIPTDKFV